MGATNAAGGRGRRGALVVGLAVLLPIAAVALLGSTVLGADHSIAIEDEAYKPGSVTVNVDDLVTWQNTDDVEHTVTADGVFDFGPIPPGGSHAVSFGQAGEYEYGCKIHSGMEGTITVLAEGGAAATPAPTEAPAPQVQGATSAPEITSAPTDALGFGGGTSSGNLAATLAAIVGAAAVAFGLAIRRMTQVR